VGTHRAWQIIDGSYPKPTDETGGQTWDNGNDFILITIRKNCEANVRSRIELAKNAYDELKKAYEGKTRAEFHALLDSITNNHLMIENLLSQITSQATRKHGTHSLGSYPEPISARTPDLAKDY